MACAGACVSLPGPRIELSAEGVRSADSGVWWYAVSDQNLRPPVVGIEQPLSKGRVRQWLVDDRGLRCFEYRGRRPSHWGPPVPCVAVSGDFAVVASLIGRRFGAPDEPGWPGPPLPDEEVAELSGSVDLVQVLQRHWASTRTDPPLGLTAHEIDLAMDATEITIADLLKSGM
ncbi:MAG: hypothetical protein ACYSUQ_12850 [Planctomycetota bacterium]